jgi:Fe-S-cluster containining protein
VRLVPELAGFDRGDGRCRYLDEKNECVIYAARPDICDVRKQWEMHWKGEYSWEGFCAMNKTACVKLMKIQEEKT